MNLDNRIKVKNEFSKIHPEFESYFVFNDDPNSTGLIRFVSYLSTDKDFAKLLATGNRYYRKLLQKDMENPVIKIMKGGYAIIPHSKFKVYGALDTDKVIYRVKALSQL